MNNALETFLSSRLPIAGLVAYSIHLPDRVLEVQCLSKSFYPSAAEDMLTGLTALGKERGVEFDQAGFAASEPLMRVQLKALVAQRLFDTAAFYRVMNPAQNEAYRRAVEILADWEHKGESLLAPED